MAVTIIGSYNIGLFLRGEKLPCVGETVICNEYYEGLGGKGSNQAIAASKFGANTLFIGCIGNDQYGKKALEAYKSLGINTRFVRVTNDTHSGISVIFVDRYGSNLISIAPGANAILSKDDIEAAELHLMKSCIVGFQLENDLEVVFYGIKKAKDLGITTFLDPAPAMELPKTLLPLIDIIKPNEKEASVITGITVHNLESANEAGEWLVQHGVKDVIITLGSKGAVLITESEKTYFPAPKVNSIDSTGAGDIFGGALMALIASGQRIHNAIKFAVKAASISTTQLGVIESIPTYEEVFENL